MTKERLNEFKRDMLSLLEKYDVYLEVNLQEDNSSVEFVVVNNNDGSEHILNPTNPYLEVRDLKGE